jgi:hypothetical protein
MRLRLLGVVAFLASAVGVHGTGILGRQLSLLNNTPTKDFFDPRENNGSWLTNVVGAWPEGSGEPLNIVVRFYFHTGRWDGVGRIAEARFDRFPLAPMRMH